MANLGFSSNIKAFNYHFNPISELHLKVCAWRASSHKVHEKAFKIPDYIDFSGYHVIIELNSSVFVFFLCECAWVCVFACNAIFEWTGSYFLGALREHFVL